MGNYETIRNLYSERKQFFARALVGLFGCLLLALLLLVKLFDLQVTRHSDYLTRANENRMRVVVVPPVRGLIFDRNGAVLAENIPSFVIEIIPEQISGGVDGLNSVIDAISMVIDISPADRERFFERAKRTPKYRAVALRTRLSMEEVARFEINRHRFNGVSVNASLTRSYPLGTSAAHVVGYVGGVSEREMEQYGHDAYRGTTHIGKTGVEKSHEVELHGVQGSRVVESNAAGRPLRELESKSSAAGKSLYLSIDTRLQLAAEKALDNREGAVVAIDPRNGEVLALVSKPGFDPHLFVEGISHADYKTLNEDKTKPLFNRALQGQYPPGSTIKPMVALGGMNFNLLNRNHKIFCPGFFELPNSDRKYRDWKRRGHGWMSTTRAIAESCDVFFYDLSQSFGIDRLSPFLGQFGLGKPTGLDLPGEKGGLLPTRQWKRDTRRENWFPGETLNVSIGQGYLTTTPVQLAQATAVLAMKGMARKPRVVFAVEEAGGTSRKRVKIENLPPVILNDAHYWDDMTNMMEETSHSIGGTALRIGAQAKYRIASKTGTAQVAGLSQEDDRAPELSNVPKHLRDHALFIAFAPADDPRIAIAVVAEHSGGGGSVAAPIAKLVMDDWLLRDTETETSTASTPEVAP